jgi:hypothetical protein
VTANAFGECHAIGEEGQKIVTRGVAFFDFLTWHRP